LLKKPVLSKLMKLLLFFLIFSCYVTGQLDNFDRHKEINDGVISFPDLNVLYRGFDNVVTFQVAGEYDSLIIRAEGASVEYLEKNKVVIIPQNVKICSLNLLSIAKGDTISHGNFEYVVLPLPNPSIYIDDKDLASFDWNNLSNEEFYNFSRIYAKYGNEIPLKVVFLISSFQISINGKIEIIKGSKWEKELKEKLKAMKKGQIFILKSVTLLGPLKFEKTMELNKYYIKKGRRK
jgi:hypothetical protein